jgi:hypothetical protein
MKAPSVTVRRASRGLGLAVGMLGVIALLGYSFDTQALYRVGLYAAWRCT